MAVLAVWAAVMLTFGVSAGNAMDPFGSGAGPSSADPSDMAWNSVDDRYSTCKAQMRQELPGYLQNERNQNSRFKAAWDSSAAIYNREWKRRKPFLGRERIIALYIYTFGPGDFYLEFNNAVRNQGPQYTTSFGFHALHFLLTDAIQALKAHRRGNECLTVYRRTKTSFHYRPNTKVRLGSFASSSMGGYSNNVDTFGDKTCFEILTCMGVDISMYSKFEIEREVLIPPYEVFKVVGVKYRSPQLDLPCEVEYTLQSTKTPVSYNDCALFK